MALSALVLVGATANSDLLAPATHTMFGWSDDVEDLTVDILPRATSVVALRTVMVLEATVVNAVSASSAGWCGSG